MSDAIELPAVSPETLARFEASRARIGDEVVARALQRQDEVSQHGAQARAILTAGLDFTTRALGIAMQLRDGEMLLQQLRWANDRLPHDGVAPEHLLARLQILADVVRETLAPADAASVNQYVGRMLAYEAELVQASTGTR